MEKKSVGRFAALLCLLWLVPAVHAEMRSVRVQKANIRLSGSLEYEVLWEVDRGDPLRVLDQDGNWLRVTNGEEIEGWIHRSTVWGWTPSTPAGSAAALGAEAERMRPLS